MTFTELEEAIRRIEAKEDRNADLLESLLRAIDASGKVLRLREAAERLSIGKTTLWRKAIAGEIKYFREGNLMYFTIEDIQDYIDRKRERSA